MQLSMMGVKQGLVLTRNLLVKTSPILLTIAGVGGVITTTVMAVKATTEAEKLVEKKKAELGMQIDEKLSIEETVKTTWKAYLPVAISAGLTIAAIVGSSAINEKRKAALAGLYALSETALKEYQEKTEEVAGKDVAQKIKDAVNTEKVKDDTCPFEPDQIVSGKCLVKDLLSGRIFLSSMQEIQAATNEINDGILSGDMYASLNDFYEIIGLDPNELGYDCGWMVGNLCKPYFTSALTKDGHPILIIDWDKHGRPSYEYRDI